MTKIYNLNDPGWGRDNKGSGNQNEPPRRPDNQDSPPDLDEVWRDFNKRLGSMFGKKGEAINRRRLQVVPVPPSNYPKALLSFLLGF